MVADSSPNRRHPRRPRRSFGKLGAAQDEGLRRTGLASRVLPGEQPAPEPPDDEQSMSKDFYQDEAPPHWGKTL